jgi:hypothetical protein
MIPTLHDLEPFEEQGVRAPQIQMALRQGVAGHRQRGNFVKPQRRVAAQALVFGGHFARPVREPPGRVNQDGAELTCQAGKLVHGHRTLSAHRYYPANRSSRDVS